MEKNKFTVNWPLVGNRHITDFLDKAIAANKLNGSYIFYGPDNLGKTTIVQHFAKILLCQKETGELPCGSCLSCLNIKAIKAEDGSEAGDFEYTTHGDCHFLEKAKDKKNISIEQVREFIRVLSMSSFLGSYKIGVIKQAETLSQEAANALLKTLEEPRDNVIIILLVKNLEFLPKTIVSRSQVLNFYPVSSEIIYNYLVDVKRASRSQAKNFSRLCLGRPALAVKFLEEKNFYDDYQDKIDIFLNFLGQDISERFLAIEESIGSKFIGQEGVKISKKILEIWQGVIRDWILMEHGHVNLIQNQIMEKSLVKLQKRFTVKELVGILKLIKQAGVYLEANVNPKTALEFVAMNL
jgi:DNA polymerase-3 subunit delta'